MSGLRLQRRPFGYKEPPDPRRPSYEDTVQPLLHAPDGVAELLRRYPDFDPSLLPPNSSSGFPYLHRACAEADIEVAKGLVACGAALTQQDAVLNTPLLLACCGGEAEDRLELVSWLVTQKGGPSTVNCPDEDGDTPIHCAGRFALKRVVKLLMLHGGDPFVSNDRGLTPYDTSHTSSKIWFRDLELKYKTLVTGRPPHTRVRVRTHLNPSPSLGRRPPDPG